MKSKLVSVKIEVWNEGIKILKEIYPHIEFKTYQVTGLLMSEGIKALRQERMFR